MSIKQLLLELLYRRAALLQFQFYFLWIEAGNIGFQKKLVTDSECITLNIIKFTCFNK